MNDPGGVLLLFPVLDFDVLLCCPISYLYGINTLPLSKMKTLPFLLLLLMIGCSKESILNPDGTFTDSRDKREYKWVRIGEQVWMAENLSTKKFQNGDDIQAVQTHSDYNLNGKRRKDTTPLIYLKNCSI